MKTPKTVQKAMRYMGMKKGDKVENVVRQNENMLKKENEAINNFNKKVYNNKRNELARVANIVKKYENLALQKEKAKCSCNERNTMVKKMARNYNNKVKAAAA